MPGLAPGFLFRTAVFGHNREMRKQTVSLETVKSKIEELKGKEVKIRLNKGRNRIRYLKGKIDETYSSVFVVKIYDDIFDRLSCTYQDVLCGDVRFKTVE